MPKKQQYGLSESAVHSAMNSSLPLRCTPVPSVVAWQSVGGDSVLLAGTQHSGSKSGMSRQRRPARSWSDEDERGKARVVRGSARRRKGRAVVVTDFMMKSLWVSVRVC
jgi:hypothetical protein